MIIFPQTHGGASPHNSAATSKERIIMKHNIRLENIEIDALKILGKIDCIAVPCSECPLNRRKHGSSVCIKIICQQALDGYQNKD